MSKQGFEIRFDKARTRMNGLLKELEKTIADKLHETSLQSKILQNSSSDKALNANNIEQLAAIQNLSEEINRLQKSLAEISKDNDALLEENKNLQKFRTQGSTLIEAIESDLVRIEEIITGERNG